MFAMWKERRKKQKKVTYISKGIIYIILHKVVTKTIKMDFFYSIILSSKSRRLLKFEFQRALLIHWLSNVRLESLNSPLI